MIEKRNQRKKLKEKIGNRGHIFDIIKKISTR
jgi:hypothetical protein